MKLVVGVSGASGVILAKRLLEELTSHETHLILTSHAKLLVERELDIGVEKFKALATFCYEEDDFLAPVASSSFPIDAMIIVPCTLKTLSGIANGYASNLLIRTAENVLKLGKKLIVVPRDTPLTLSSLENMVKLKRGGAIILPPMMAYYYKPKNIEDVTNFFVGKILEVLGIDHNLYPQWRGEP